MAVPRSAARAGSGAGYRLMLAGPLVHLALSGFTGDAVALLDDAHKLVAVALQLHHVVVRQLAPLLPYVALELVPVSADGIPVEMHLDLLPVDHTWRLIRASCADGSCRCYGLILPGRLL